MKREDSPPSWRASPSHSSDSAAVSLHGYRVECEYNNAPMDGMKQDGSGHSDRVGIRGLAKMCSISGEGKQDGFCEFRFVGDGNRPHLDGR